MARLREHPGALAETVRPTFEDKHLAVVREPHHRISRLCRALGVTRTGYHAWKKRPPSQRAIADALQNERIAVAFEASRCTYGAPRMHAELRAQGVFVARKRIARLMREAGRHARRRPTGPGAQTQAAPDLVRRSYTADELDAMWLADITCQRMRAGSSSPW